MDAKLFTVEGIKVTILHNLILLGLLGVWMFVNVKILGNEVVAFDDSRAAKVFSKK